MTELLIRVDANPEIALGHLKRCLALAKALVERGVGVLMACSPDAGGDRLLVSSGVPWRHVSARLGAPGDIAQTAAMAAQTGARTVLLDSYVAQAATIEALRSAGLRVAYIDDLGQVDLPCDLVLNGLPGAENLEYRCPEKLIGKECLILAPEYWGGCGEDSERCGLLVTMGGVDHYDYSCRTLEMLDALGVDIDVTVIIGPYYENIGAIRAAAAVFGGRVRLVHSPDSLHPFMCGATAAVSAGGMTLYELATVGVPTVGIALWENQFANVRELGSMGIIEAVWHGRETTRNDFSGALCVVLRDEERRAEMRRRGREHFDGRGALRVADKIRDWTRSSI